MSRGTLIAAACTVGFGTAVVMWLVGFITHLPFIGLSGMAVALPLLLLQVLGGVVAGRLSGSAAPWLVGGLAGFVTSTINLLIVGSVLAIEEANELRPGWPMIIGGFLVFGVVAGALGATLSRFIGARGGEPRAAAGLDGWLGRFAVVACASALPVLLSGGLVTSTGTGLAVPDWPTSYNANMFLYPLSKMTGGIYYEHAHRLFGSLVGFTTLALFVFVLMAERRGWVKALGLFAFLFVCGQGVLGGVRVTAATATTDEMSPQTLADNPGSLALAMVHGITAQLFFGLLCALAAILSLRWKEASNDQPSSDDGALRRASLFMLIALVIQLSFGSATRHFNHGHAMWSHVGFSLVAFLLTCVAGFRAMKHREEPVLKKLGHATIHSVSLQMLLGLATLISVFPYKKGVPDPAHAVALATAHQALGAVLIGCAAMLVAWSRRFRAAADTSEA